MKKNLLAVLLFMPFLFSCASTDLIRENYIVNLKNKYQEQVKKLESASVVHYDLDKAKAGKIEGSQYHVELRGVNVNSFIDLVFGEILKYPYVVDQSIQNQGKSLDINIKRKINKRDLYNVAVKALERIGFFVEDDGGAVFIFNDESKQKKQSVYHVKLRHVSSKDIETALAAHRDEKIQVKLSGDGRRNIIISGESEAVKRYAKIVQAFDQEQSRVKVDVQIYEATLTGSLKYGLESLIKAVTGQNFISLNTISQNKETGFQASLVIGENIKVALDILKKEDQLKTLANPFIICNDGKTSQFEVGTQIPILTQKKTTEETSSEYEQINYVSTGIKVQITPVVLSDNDIMLNYNLEVSKGVQNTISQLNSPMIVNRHLQSEIRLRSGQSIIIGGLIQKQDEKISHTIPGLAEWSRLLGSYGQDNLKTELIMILTPEILNTNEKEINQEIVEKFKMI